MKKLIAILALVTLLVSTLIVPTSAAAGDNVMTKVINDTKTMDGCVMFGCTVENDARVPANMFDGKTEYSSSVSETYVSYKMSASKIDIIAEIAPKFNADGEELAEGGDYLALLRFELDKVYTVDSFNFWGQQFSNPAVTIEGFDILVSETGEKGSWKVVHSLKEASCGKIDTKWSESPATNPEYTSNVKYSASFEPVNAKFVAIGVTQPRCQHTEALAAACGATPNSAPHYFRIAEFELLEAKAAAPATTEAPATTAAPETTAAPVTEAPATTAAPAETPATADATVIVAGMALMAAALLVVTRRRATK